MVGIDEHQRAHAVSGELLDHRTARARTADHGDAQPAQPRVGPRPERLRDALAKTFDLARLTGVPERQIVAYDIHMCERLEAARLIDDTAEHAPIVHHDRAAVRTTVGPAVDAGKQRAIGRIVDLRETVEGDMAVDLHNR